MDNFSEARPANGINTIAICHPESFHPKIAPVVVKQHACDYSLTVIWRRRLPN